MNGVPEETHAIHLWFGKVGRGDLSSDEPPAWFTRAEWDRWSSFSAPQARTRYLLRHLALRRVLGGWLGVPEDEVALSWLPSGQPQTDHQREGLQLAVSMASREDRVLLGACWGGALGVDFEPLRPLPDLTALALTALHPDERRSLARRQQARRAGFFLRLWVRKEALLKAAGVGLRSDPRQINVLGSPLRPAKVQVRLVTDEGSMWFVQDIAMAAGQLTAVCSDQPWPSVVAHPWRLDADRYATRAQDQLDFGRPEAGGPE
ncbi:MAG TPA: 4'-phosphopantetheinyl transferase superfamily protein [Anaerolineales bacterium]